MFQISNFSRKYVRDSERVYLANKSLDTAILCAEIRTEGQDSTGHYDDRLTNVMTVYRVYHYCTKMASTTDPKQVARAKAALSKIYATAMNIKVRYRWQHIKTSHNDF